MGIFENAFKRELGKNTAKTASNFMSELEQELNKLKPIECHEAFNVFRALRKESDEVQLHSRFIASLLDPRRDNPLGLGTRPLELFLEQIGSQFHVGPNTRLTPGWNPSNWSEDKEIDILIEDEKQGFAIIIENKIYATDSNHLNRGQLEGYHRYITGKDSGKDSDKDSDKRDKTYDDKRVEVYYLTLDGHKPSEKSLGTKEKGYLHLSDNHEPRSVKLIQYRKEICGWLNLCLDEVSNRPYVKSAIEQYRDLIGKLAGDVELHQELARLAGKYPEEAWTMIQNGDKNSLLVQKKKDVLWHGIVDFLNELESALRAGFEIEPRTTPLYEAVTDLIFGHKKSDEIYFRIPDKRGFVWTLQSNSHEKGRFFLGIDKKTNHIQLDPSLLEGEDNGWFCHIDLTPEVYLADILNKEKTFECIMVPNKRVDIISKYVSDIKTIIFV